MTSAAAQLNAFRDSGRRVRSLDLRLADLAGADLSRLAGDDLDVRGADLRRAQLRAARLGSCRFEKAMLEQADFSEATIRACVLDGAHAADARFDGARIEDSTASGIDLTRASLRRAKLTETSFARAVMREAVLDDAEGDGVEFRGADLAGATLAGARLDEADFRGADLRGANMSRARFRSADFRGALLDGTIFDGADCAGASFDANAGPHASDDAKRSAEGRTGFDDAVLATLRELMTQLPAVLAAREGPAADLLARVESAGETLGAGASRNPDEWKSWAEKLIALTRAEQPADLRTVLTALTDAPLGLHGGRGTPGDHRVADVVDRLQATFHALGAAGDEPPEEWQPILKMLMGMTAGDRPVDLNALLDQLALVGKRQAGETPPATS